jgi:hypothetical protein
LTAVVDGDGTVTKESWTLDGTGNMGDANDANEITTSGYVYDRAGNMVADGTKIYQYDAWNRLVAVSADDEGEPGDPLAAYQYDGLNRRIISIADTDSDCDLDTATHYYYGEMGSGPICRNGPEGAAHKWDLTPFPCSDQQVIEPRDGCLASDPSSLAGGVSSLSAQKNTAADQRADLLTAVMHEMGHLLGYGDTPADDLMGAILPLGVRRTA